MKKSLLSLMCFISILNAQSILDKCDLNNNGVIDSAQLYDLKTKEHYITADLKIIEFIAKEKKCATEYLITHKEESEKVIKFLAMLDTQEATKAIADEIKKTEEALAKEQDVSKKEKLLMRIDILKSMLENLEKQHA
ncbi:MAG: hypothetical protein PHW18_12640 [Sulfuricurvum sp.]|uniref:hypothetical protein n=1 Tax=Sulfuricurvum sp. TaxID=2025608 RepID=UPI00261EF889|nr:hypothetical protein [Sulfuricurvum sp.]MDD2830414.1 hypothetical protein [Sulfuricurvum sp.]MDD4948867.1 hypothetical protein [Sulfuricurvum sp.]